MHFQRNRKFKQARPTEGQIIRCRQLGIEVTGEMSIDDVSRLIDRAQPKFIKALLLAAGIREGSVINFHRPGYSPGLWVVTRILQGQTWARSLEANGKRQGFSTMQFESEPPTLNYSLAYNAAPEWTHAFAVVPVHASNARTAEFRKRTDALQRYMSTQLLTQHKMTHEVYGEYWSTAEVARLKALFEQEFPQS